MIEINLIPGKKKKASGGGLTLPDFSELAKNVRDPLLVGAIAVWAIVLPVIGFIFFTERKTTPIMEEIKPMEAKRRGKVNIRIMVS